MVIKLSSLKVDVKAERSGEWVPVKEWAGFDPEKPWEITKTPGLSFHVRSLNAPEYRTARQALLEELERRKKAYADNVIPSDVIEAEEGRLLAEHILLGWEGFDEAYSADLARTQLAEPAARTLRDMVTFCASRVGKRRAEFLEDGEKK